MYLEKSLDSKSLIIFDGKNLENRLLLFILRPVKIKDPEFLEQILSAK